MTQSVKFPIVDAKGDTHEVDFGLHTYKAAAKANMNVTQFMSDMVGTNAPLRVKGQAPKNMTEMSPMEQMINYVGIHTRPNPVTGARASTMDELMATDPLTTSDQGVIPGIARRLLAPEIILQIANINLIENPDELMAAWDRAISSTTSVNGKQVGQPLMNEVNANSAGLVSPSHIGQLQMPDMMITYTLGDRQWNIPTRSVGLMFSKEVLQHETLDRVGLTMAQNFRAFAINRYYEDLATIINGDSSTGVAPVSFANISTLQSGFTFNAANKMTNRAWVKWMLQDVTKFRKNIVLGSADAYLDYIERQGVPVVTSDVSSDSNRMPGPASVIAMGIPSPLFIPLPPSVIGADRLIGFERERGLRKLQNISADYSAVEELVLRGGVGMRFDTGVMLVKDNPGVFSGLTIGV
jgi:hypothetical protein